MHFLTTFRTFLRNREKYTLFSSFLSETGLLALWSGQEIPEFPVPDPPSSRPDLAECDLFSRFSGILENSGIFLFKDDFWQALNAVRRSLWSLFLDSLRNPLFGAPSGRFFISRCPADRARQAWPGCSALRLILVRACSLLLEFRNSRPTVTRIPKSFFWPRAGLLSHFCSAALPLVAFSRIRCRIRCSALPLVAFSSGPAACCPSPRGWPFPPCRHPLSVIYPAPFVIPDHEMHCRLPLSGTSGRGPTPFRQPFLPFQPVLPLLARKGPKQPENSLKQPETARKTPQHPQTTEETGVF